MTEPNVTAVVRESRSSIELQRAKDGTYYWTVKRYYDESDPDERQRALVDIADADLRLRAMFLDGGIDAVQHGGITRIVPTDGELEADLMASLDAILVDAVEDAIAAEKQRGTP